MIRNLGVLATAIWGFSVAPTAGQSPATLTVADCAITETPGIAGPCSWDALDQRLRLNDLQTLGTHNSSHIAPTAAEGEAIVALLGQPQADGFAYTFPTLTGQLEMGVRNFEIDVQYDPDRVRPEPPGPGAEGDYRVFHSALDWRSTCGTLRACMTELAGWSRAHPDHVPIVIYVQLKPPGVDPRSLVQQPGYRPTQPFDQARIKDIESTVVETFGRDRLFTPDQLRGGLATLRAAAISNRWPTLAEMRGRVVVVLHEDANGPDSPGPDAVVEYRAQNPGLRGRAMFIITDDDLAPDAAFVNVRDPEPSAARIEALVTSGFIVRRRTDVDLVEGRTGDGRRRDAAITAGVQTLATDFIQPHAVTGYVVRLGSAARCAPTRPVCREPVGRVP